MHSIFYFFSSCVYLVVCQLELTKGEKNRPRSFLGDCYKSSVPSACAFIALLVSQSKSFKKPGTANELCSELQFLDHFRAVLGDDIAHVLARQLRDHVRRLAALIVAKVDKIHARRKKALLQEEENEQVRMKSRLMTVLARQNSEEMELDQQQQASQGVDMDVVDEKKDSIHAVASEKREEKGQFVLEKEKQEAYEWLLAQLRVFLTAYWLLDEFFHRQLLANTNGDRTKQNGKNNTLAWPLVCFFVFFCFCFFVFVFLFRFVWLFVFFVQLFICLLAC
jgi:Fe2+ transport system protein B